MELSSGKIGAFTLVPKFNDNRELPEGERLSLTIKPLRRVDVLAQIGWDENRDEVYRWRDDKLRRWVEDKETGDSMRQLPFNVLTGWRQFANHTADFRNFVFDGEEKKDPAEIFILLAGELGNEDSLLSEIQDAIRSTALLTGEELKNFVAQCGGLS